MNSHASSRSYTPPGIEHADLRVAHRMPFRAQSWPEAAVGRALDWIFWHRSGKYADGVPCYTYRERRTGGWR